jgi:O-antigen/teichoic acid export membrane protein
MAAQSVFSLIYKGGLFDAIRKTVPEYRNDSESLSAIAAASFGLTTVYGIIATAIVIICLLLGIIPKQYKIYVWILLGLILFDNLSVFPRGYFYGTQNEHVTEIFKITRKVIYSVSALILAYYGYGLIGVFAGYVLSFVVVGFISVILLLRETSFCLQDGSQTVNFAKDLASYGGFQLIGGLSAVLLYKTDILLVQFFHGQTSTALYQSAIVPAEMLWIVPSAIQAAFLQDTAKNWAQNNTEKINDNIREGVKYSVLSLSLFGVGLFVLAEPFITVYFGPQYSDSVLSLRILIVGVVLMGVTRPINAVLQATGWIRQTELVSAGALIINIICNVILIPRFGIIGAAVGTTISYTAMFVAKLLLWYWSEFRLITVAWAGKIAITQVLFLIGFLIIVSRVQLEPLVSLISLPFIGLLLFLIINTYMGYIERARIIELVKAPRG